jgi:hypothetical protein
VTEILGLMPLASLFISWFIYYERSGLSKVKSEERVDWREFFLPNLPWFLLMWAKCFTWPIVLIVWLARGAPASPWRAVTVVNGRPARAIVRTTPRAPARS